MHHHPKSITTRRRSVWTRKRRRTTTVMWSVVAAAVCLPTSVGGFVANSPLRAAARFAPSLPTLHSTSTSLFSASKPKKKANDGSYSPQQPQRQPRLTHEEQTDLLNQAVEARHIRQQQQELALTTPQQESSLLQQQELATKTGYDSIEEMLTALDAGQAARETLVTRNMGLVHFCVQDILRKRRLHKSASSGLSTDDLVQEGAIGLARAVDRWDPAIGGRFSTYAVYWIRALVLRCLAEHSDDLVRVPEHVQAAVSKVTRAAQTLGLTSLVDANAEADDWVLSSSSSSSPSWKEAAAAKALAVEAGLTDRQVTEAIKIKHRRSMGRLSFESWMQQGKDYESDTAAVGSSVAADELERDHLKQTLARFLRPREMEALSWRYGLNSCDDEKSSTSTNAAATASTKSSRKTKSATKPRDYVAEAEEHLFGSSSASPREPSQPQPKKQLAVGGKGGEALSFVEVGKRMQVSAEYGRRLCHAALHKLRQAAEEGALEPGLLF